MGPQKWGAGFPFPVRYPVGSTGCFVCMRIRTIKPSFWSSDQIAELNPLTRLLFIGLWGLADVAGRLEDRPKRIKVELLPYDEIDIDGALSELAKAGFIARYHAEGVKIIQVVNFCKHQRIMGKEAETESSFPEYDKEKHGETTGKHPGSTGETPGNAGREGKGKEGKDQPPAGKFSIPSEEELRLHASEIGLPIPEMLKFQAFYESKGWMVGKRQMKSWVGAMAGWKIRWEEERGVKSPSGPKKPFVPQPHRGIFTQEDLDILNAAL